MIFPTKSDISEVFCLVAVTLAIELILMNAIGIFIRKSGIVNKDFSSRLTNLILKFCIPCLIFNSVSNAAAFSLDLLANCGLVVVLAAVAVLISFGVGQVFFLLSRGSGSGRILRYGLTFCHFSFMGIPVMEALFGEMGTFYYVSFFLLPVRIAYYAFSDVLMTPRELQGPKRGVGKMLKDIFLNPCMIALILALIFWIGGWHLPTALNYCVKSMSSISSPLALLLCGMVLGEYNFKQLIRVKYLLLPLLRTILMPAIFFGVSRLLLLLGVEKLLCDMMVIYAAFPVASLLPIYTIRFDPDPDNQLNAAAASILSVLISAVTIPIWYLFL